MELKLTGSPEVAMALAVVVPPNAIVSGLKLMVPMVWLALTVLGFFPLSLFLPQAETVPSERCRLSAKHFSVAGTHRIWVSGSSGGVEQETGSKAG
jgi:hypothetical protein